ncbi:MAG: hypothetical protein ABI702_00375 [Burkholderiales bacterium]
MLDMLMPDITEAVARGVQAHQIVAALGEVAIKVSPTFVAAATRKSPPAMNEVPSHQEAPRGPESDANRHAI